MVARESTFREIGAIRSDVMGFRNIWGIGYWGRSVYGFTAGGVLIDIERLPSPTPRIPDRLGELLGSGEELVDRGVFDQRLLELLGGAVDRRRSPSGDLGSPLEVGVDLAMKSQLILLDERLEQRAGLGARRWA